MGTFSDSSNFPAFICARIWYTRSLTNWDDENEIADYMKQGSSHLSHDLIRVTELTPSSVGNLADKIPGPSGNDASLSLKIRGEKEEQEVTHTKIPRFGKSLMAVERGSSVFIDHLWTAPRR